MHKSIHKTIRHHNFENSSTPIDSSLDHYNNDWEEEYAELSKYKSNSLSSIELGYNTTLRYFYFYSFLCRIRDIKDYDEFIDINGERVKVALTVTAADKQAISEDLNFLEEIKKENGKLNYTPIQMRASTNYFRYFVKKYYNELLSAEVEALKIVPCQLNEDGNDIIILPGWFVVYGDGGEKINRIRCAVPAIINKLDYLERKAKEDEERVVQSNEIGKDGGDIDLAINHNSKTYSASRYYQCDTTPYKNDVDNDRKS